MMEAEGKLEALLLADYTHMPFEEYDRVQNNANVEILCMDSIIVNGAVSVGTEEGLVSADTIRVMSTACRGEIWTT